MTSWLELIAFGFDSFSGARKMFRSKRYTLADIKDGGFSKVGLGVVERTR